MRRYMRSGIKRKLSSDRLCEFFFGNGLLKKELLVRSYLKLHPNTRSFTVHQNVATIRVVIALNVQGRILPFQPSRWDC